MRKLLINKWFLLGAFLTISFSAFSFVAFKKTQSVCSAARECCQHSVENTPRNELLWDVVSRQFANFISVQ